MQFLNDHDKLQVRIIENQERKEIAFRFFQDKKPIQIEFERGEVVRGEQDIALLQFSLVDREMSNSWSGLLERLGKCMAKKLKVKYNMKSAHVPQMLHKIHGPHPNTGQFHVHTQVLRSLSSPLFNAPIKNVVLALHEIVCDEDKSVWMRFHEVRGVTVKDGDDTEQQQEEKDKEEGVSSPELPAEKEGDQKDEELSLNCMLVQKHEHQDTESLDGGDTQGSVNELDYDNYVSFIEESNNVIEQAKKEITRRDQELHHLKRATVKFIKSCNSYQMGEPNEDYKKQMSRLQNLTMKKE